MVSGKKILPHGLWKLLTVKKMEHYSRPDLQAIEEEITLLANESTMTTKPT